MNLGWGPGTYILDTPLNMDFWDGENPPRDPIASTNGPMTIREALGNSMNIPAVKAILSTGIPETIAQAKRMGFTSLDNRQLGPSMAIGGVDIKLVDLVYGYTVFPNQGLLKGVATRVDRDPGNRELDPISILKVTDRRGNVLYPIVEGQPAERPAVQEVRVTPPEESYLISSILSDPNAHCRTYGSCGYLSIPGRPMGVKTGTSEPYEDSRAIGETWTVGFTPQLVVGTWFGNADNTPMTSISSTNVSWHTVRDFATQFHEALPVEEFEQPAEVVRAATCIVSNLRPDDGCPRSNSEDWLARHAVPTRDDDWWTSAAIDTRTNKLASEFTPPQFIRYGRFLQLPEGISEYQQDQALEWARVVGGTVGSAPTESTTADDIPVMITSPANGAQVEGSVAVTGRAASSDFRMYRLEYQGVGADSWEVIGQSDNQVSDGVLGFFDTTDLEPGPYTLRLVLLDGQRGDITVSIVVVVLGDGGGGGPDEQPADGDDEDAEDQGESGQGPPGGGNGRGPPDFAGP
jgi:membrane carboxypeptidase/penicillin-binding protein PbpC